nr:hypothetical protein [Tanacetum cinerariifolium]
PGFGGSLLVVAGALVAVEAVVGVGNDGVDIRLAGRGYGVGYLLNVFLADVLVEPAPEEEVRRVQVLGQVGEGVGAAAVV